MSTRPASPIDANPRPMKRQRRVSASSDTKEVATPPSLAPIPIPVLLVSLPGLLIHPPTHRYHAHSLCVSILSLRKCLNLPNLTADIECRAWTALAEVGMITISGGFSQDEDHPWAKHIEHEVEKAAGKALMIAKKHPSLSLYRAHVTCITAQLSLWQQNPKFARNMLRQLLKTLPPTEPPHSLYSVHLNLISNLCLASATTPTTMAKDTQAALSHLHALTEFSENNGHIGIKLLALVTRLRLLVSSGLWDRVEDALISAEEAFGLTFAWTDKAPEPEKPVAESNAPESQNYPQSANPAVSQTVTDTLSQVLAIHVLIIGVSFHTYIGNSAGISPRLMQLHILMDAGSWRECGNGVVEIPFPSSRPLYVQTTHPRILLILAFLVSAVAKKDPVGRKPKRRVFALEGLTTWEKEMRKPLEMAPGASVSDVEQLELTMSRLKGDLLCELVSVHIMRSEFASAQNHIDVLVAHVRSTGLWDTFSARVMLYEAHLAHAKGVATRAAECYAIAAELASSGVAKDIYLEVCARAGTVALRIGSGNVDVDEGLKVAADCKGMGGTMRSIGKIIESCLSPEILKSKNSLKTAMTITGEATDNHLRALVLALMSAHFMHTATDYAMKMLSASEQLVVGFGAGSAKGVKNATGADMVGNVPMRLWVAERVQELYKRQGDNARAEKQARTIEALRNVRAST